MHVVGCPPVPLSGLILMISNDGFSVLFHPYCTADCKMMLPLTIFTVSCFKMDSETKPNTTKVGVCHPSAGMFIGPVQCMLVVGFPNKREYHRPSSLFSLVKILVSLYCIDSPIVCKSHHSSCVSTSL